MSDYQRDSRYGDDNEVLALPAEPRKIHVATSCGIVPGHEHATQEEAWRCIATTLQERVRAKIAELRTGENVRRPGWQIADELEALLGEG